MSQRRRAVHTPGTIAFCILSLDRASFPTAHTRDRHQLGAVREHARCRSSRPRLGACPRGLGESQPGAYGRGLFWWLSCSCRVSEVSSGKYQVKRKSTGRRGQLPGLAGLQQRKTAQPGMRCMPGWLVRCECEHGPEKQVASGVVFVPIRTARGRTKPRLSPPSLESSTALEAVTLLFHVERFRFRFHDLKS